MKKIFIRDFPNYLEREISEIFYLKDITYSITDGPKWQDFHLMDISGRVLGKCWAENIKKEYSNYVGMIVRVNGRVELYRDAYAIRLIVVAPVQDSEYDPKDFQPGITPGEQERLLRRLRELISSVTNKRYQALLNAIFTPQRIKKFSDLSGAHRYHHVFTGGWLRHTVEVAEIVLFSVGACCKSPVELVAVDLDCLLAAALLFDVGKINQFQERLCPSLTIRGKLVGAVHDSAVFITCANNTLPDDRKVTDLTQLLHVVVSAHPDSAVKPMTKEAVVVSRANAMSLSFAAYDGLFYDYDRWHPDEAGKSQAFSRYFNTDMVRPGKEGLRYV